MLSFAGAGDEDGFRHLGDGLAEDLATELGRFRELDVIAPTTALAYRHARVAPERAGAELGTGLRPRRPAQDLERTAAHHGPVTSCIDWLLAMDPFQLPSDTEHYASGLRKAGFE